MIYQYGHGIWYAMAVSWAESQGVIKGDEQKRLNPKGTATRAEVAQVMMNYLEK